MFLSLDARSESTPCCHPSYHAIRVDETTLRALGEPVAVFGDAKPSDAEGTSIRPLSLSDNGLAAFLPGAAGYPVTFDWMDRDGHRSPSGAASSRFIDADLSWDARKLAVSETSGGVFTLTVRDLERKTTERIADEGSNWTGRWVPDSERIAVTSRQVAALNLTDSTKSVMASGRTEALDGARVSPGGRWLSLLSTLSGQTELYVLPFPQGGPFTRVSSGGAGGGWLAGPWVARALWSATTPEVFYRRGDELLAVTYRETDNRFIVVNERTIFRLPAFELVGISRDASRFLVAVAEGPAPSRDIGIVLNWPAQLQKRGTD